MSNNNNIIIIESEENQGENFCINNNQLIDINPQKNNSNKRTNTITVNSNKKNKNNSKKTSWVWELMESTEIEEEGLIIKAAICKINVSKTSEIKYCNIIVRGGSDSSTSNFINHLMSVHGLTKDNYESKLNSKVIIY